MNTDRNVIFTSICAYLNVIAKFETSGKNKRPAVATGGIAGGYAHLLCNPKNIMLVNALVDKGVKGDWFAAPKQFGENADYRAFLYACGTAVRDVRGKGHVSSDSVTGKVQQDAAWIGWCQAYATTIVANKATGIAQSVREGRVNGNLPSQVSAAATQLAVKDLLQNDAPATKVAKALTGKDFANKLAALKMMQEKRNGKAPVVEAPVVEAPVRKTRGNRTA